MSEATSSESKTPGRNPQILFWALSIGLLVPYGLLAILSLGSGWSFPNLLPDRIDFRPWKRFAEDRNGLGSAALSSFGRCLIVSVVSTIAGLIAGRAIRNRRSLALRFLAYLPFVLSPVVVGVCLFDLMIRVGLAGTSTGVVLCQIVFSFSYATVLFSELWTPRMEKAEQVVRTLGGRSWDVWRHAVLPQAKGAILVCLIQTALSSWLDYAIVSVIGGGTAASLTMRLFASLREASVNQAALSSLILLFPAIVGFAIAITLLRPKLAPVLSDTT